jgi:hypothetical protein
VSTTPTIEALALDSLKQVDQFERGAVAVLSQCIAHGATLDDIIRLGAEAGWDYARIKAAFERAGARL